MIKNIKNIFSDLDRLGPVLLFTILAPALGALTLTATVDSWFTPLKDSGSYIVLLFICCATILAGLSLIPTHAVSLVAGMLFGASLGPLYAIFAILFACLVSYYVSKAIIGNQLIDAICKRPTAEKLYKELLQESGVRTIYITALVRLSPIMPFAATNILLAAAKLKLSEFTIGSLLGLAPRIILVALAGAGLKELDLSKSGGQELIILGIAATIATIVILGKLSKKILHKTLTTEQETKLG
ncbi:MAG: VTT domain-containing protein [Lentisphaeraceae bacterium]|nr:VTT domain-containing protein [Lentisphaeraceae bacterium]